MMMNKILVKLYVPIIGGEYDIWIPLNKRIYNVINLLVKAVYEFSGGYYKPDTLPLLYDKSTAKPYELNQSIKETNIRNGSEIILI